MDPSIFRPLISEKIKKIMLQENKGKLLNIYSNTNKNYAMSEKL
jgi:hypothetical protein